MLCKKCGAQIPDDAIKCEYCGEVFKEEPVAEEKEDLDNTKVINVEEKSDIADAAEDLSQKSTHEIFEENARKRKSQNEKVVDEKQVQLDEITQRRNQKKQKQKRNRIILIACICVLVAGAAGAGTYYLRNSGFGFDTVIASPTPSVSPIPTLAPVPSSEVSTPEPTATAEAAEGNSSQSSGGSSSSGSGSSSGGSSSGGTSSGASSESGQSWKSTSSNASSSKSESPAVVTNTNKYSGVVSENITSKLIIGNEVVYDQPSDKYFMTFNMDGVMYYANVSKGSTTEQIKGKPITITAVPTNGRYDGNTVYEITSMTYYEGDYIIADSGTRLIDKSELKDMNKKELGLARNEIYARHGRKFQMYEYQSYFETKSWYKENPNYDYTDDNKNLNSIELKNVETILSVENSK